MGIWSVITGNLAKRRLTIRLPGEAPRPVGFRGPVVLDEAKCVCCGMCRYACVSEAIAVGYFADRFTWEYRTGRCTFCGKCVEVCPSRALSQKAESPAACERPAELDAAREVPFPPCARCGRPALPITDTVLLKAFREIGEDVASWSRLCLRCRRSRYSMGVAAGLKPALGRDLRRPE
ncbi:MAG TPA: 4Fe-4S binding protein [Candidatus Aminicenantes bacterium]|nr:4Fe-4S binding protein [Candidatus Aminicenantes bacterium]HRY64797.1 4Fe-4S binding protein [Candidatus Aminicenantes bacterium]HRZ71710.1 4Fe-4S binding protein [Candidatus Aminicenantes bacterium]